MFRWAATADTNTCVELPKAATPLYYCFQEEFVKHTLFLSILICGFTSVDTIVSFVVFYVYSCVDCYKEASHKTSKFLICYKLVGVVRNGRNLIGRRRQSNLLAGPQRCLGRGFPGKLGCFSWKFAGEIWCPRVAAFSAVFTVISGFGAYYERK